MQNVDEKFIDEMYEIFKNRRYAEPELGNLLCKMFLNFAKEMKVDLNDENIEGVAEYTAETWKRLLKIMLVVVYKKEKNGRKM